MLCLGRAQERLGRDHESAGEMTFDYVLRDGVIETTNALEVLRRAGVDIRG